MLCCDIAGKHVECIAMEFVKITRLKVTYKRVVGTNKVKRDVHNVSYSSNGRVCGVHAADGY